jgi:hypothetical protein
LGNALEEAGDSKRALTEFKYSLEMIKNDPYLDEEEKRALRQEAEKRIAALKIQLERTSPFAESKLTGFELNIIVLGFFIALFLVFECIKGAALLIEKRQLIREQSRIWVDRYWERRKEQEIRRFPLPVFPTIMHLVFLLILIKAYFILKKHGFNAGWESFILFLRSLFQ